MANKIKEGAWTGLMDLEGCEICAGDTIEDIKGEKYRVNTYQQAVPIGEGMAIDLHELFHRAAGAIKVCEPEPKAEDEKPATKVCKCCGRELPVSEFGKHARTKDGLQPTCRECKAKAMKGRKLRRLGKVVQVVEVQSPATIRLEPEQIPAKTIADYTPQELVAELRRRGYEVKATRTIIEEL